MSELSRELTAREFSSWIAFFELEPYERRADERMAITCSTIARCAGNNISPEDFLGEKRRQTVDEQIAILRAAGKQNGK